jgi:putative nucleotidyltransferase with HDIG domain
MAAWIKHRSPLKRFVFNASNQMFTGIIFLSILSHAGYYFPELKFPGQFIVTILLSIFVYLTTTSLIALGIKLERGVPFRHTWMENFSWLGPYFIAMGVIGYALIFSYQKIGFIGLVVIIVPLLVLRYSQTLFIRRTKESVEKLNKTNQMLAATSAEVTKLNEKLLDVLSYVIDMRDPFLLGHSQQVVFYAVKIAEQLGLTPERIEIIRKGGLIHDIGKLGIPEGILGKKSQLTPEEYEIVKQHVNIGAKILQRSEALENVVPMVYHHHEHFDGSGYPEGLKGKEIPLEARILALADSIEAMASDRPYRSGATFDKILKEVEKNRGTHFDPQVVDAFFEIVKEMNEPFVVNTTEQVSSDVGFSFRDSLNSEATG